MPYTNDTKPSNSYTNDTETSNSFTNESEPVLGGYLKKEDNFYLLLESGCKIILDSNALFTNDTKP